MKKNLLLILMAIGFTFTMAACSGDSDEKAEGEEEFIVRLAMSVPETHASPMAMNEVKDEIEEKSDGRIVIEVYENGQLFPSDREAVEAVQIGNVEATAVATPTVATFNERFSIFDMPFLFDDREAAYKAIDGEVGEILNSELKEAGLISLGYGENGFRHILNDKHPIEKPEDLEGMKFRVLENKVYEDMFNELGANSSPLAFGELYTALQQGVYSGMDNPISLVYTMKFFEVQDYMTLSSHTFAPIVTVINQDFYDSMPEDLQEVLTEGMDKFNDRQREITQEQDEEYIEDLKEELEVNELTEEQKEVFKEALEPIYDKYEDIIGEELLEMAKKTNE